MYQYLEIMGLKAEFVLFKCCLVALCKLQFEVPVWARGWFAITRQNVTMGFSLMCTYKV